MGSTYVCAGANGNADVGLNQRWGVVHAVTNEQHSVAVLLLKASHRVNLKEIAKVEENVGGSYYGTTFG